MKIKANIEFDVIDAETPTKEVSKMQAINAVNRLIKSLNHQQLMGWRFTANLLCCNCSRSEGLST